MDSKDVNLLAQLLITGLDLWFLSQKRGDELYNETKDQLLDRLERANQQLKDLSDLETGNE